MNNHNRNTNWSPLSPYLPCAANTVPGWHTIEWKQRARDHKATARTHGVGKEGKKIKTNAMNKNAIYTKPTKTHNPSRLCNNIFLGIFFFFFAAVVRCLCVLEWCWLRSWASEVCSNSPLYLQVQQHRASAYHLRWRWLWLDEWSALRCDKIE